ncbi:MAG: tRNA-(ms[2]io[6]A)-hydroxylase [Pseudomonadales bacterium]|jgi:tRNA-(ms[2]io[6]A)-hydroxylase|nr:tRNA-(ms[2]io[6]A)-hydroxylase [Pseudomonadales bacterium]MDP6473135.1 tRNA-(ms[2]io[6]A)-hydroxylase [Pseudomonadales bacterium]MDP6826108.1 tRNA-(ms[2]io[6]A)-hydroxylase [Pseudomonadales bacterium]MDP6971516.1 tRNA-(ms[2]io[6]A)-hydroxylase [Pseudomonadales bacterium]|tara:strand:- start:1689 stop:2318 length:630 start_codon:yes stop_codon:yes gene_type:complete
MNTPPDSQNPEIERACDFLRCATPKEWVDQAVCELPALLIDHANCEKKAAGTALSLLYRYIDDDELMTRLSRIAREELRHFEQVLAVMRELAVPYRHLTSSRYAGELRKLIATHEPARLIDTLLVCAIIEARSCERFARLVEVLPEVPGRFYRRLLDSEARHFRVYLDLARGRIDGCLDERLEPLLDREAELVLSADDVIRFHSGPLPG